MATPNDPLQAAIDAKTKPQKDLSVVTAPKGSQAGFKETLAASEKQAADTAKLQEDFLAGKRQAFEAAQGQVGVIEKQTEADKLNLRRQAAQALLAARGSTATPSGARLASLRATGAATGRAEASLMSEAAQRRLEAEQAAGEAQAAFAAEQKKIQDQGVTYAKQIADAQNDIDNIIKKYEGTIYTDQDDRNKMAKALRARVKLYAGNPDAQTVLMNAIVSLEKGQSDKYESGAIDV